MVETTPSGREDIASISPIGQVTPVKIGPEQVVRCHRNPSHLRSDV